MTLLSDVRVKRKVSCQYYINVWLSMISGHVANKILFFKKNKDWMSRTLATTHPLGPIISHFCLTPTSTLHPQSERHPLKFNGNY